MAQSTIARHRLAVSGTVKRSTSILPMTTAISMLILTSLHPSDPSLIESIQSSCWTVRCVLTCDGPIALGILPSLAFIGHLNGCLLNIRAAVLQYGTGDIKYGHSLAFVIAAAFILQLFTGFIITSLVVLNLDLSFSALVY